MYNFPSSGAGLAFQIDIFVDGKFLHMVDPKDGYLVRDLRNAMHHRLLKFLVPIIHLDKPTQVTITIGNTIFDMLDGGRPVDWGLVFRDLAQKLVAVARKAKPIPIYPFLFHLYHSRDILTEEEDTNYRAAQELINYRIIPDPEPGSHSVSEEEDEETGNLDQLAKSLEEEQQL